MYGFISGIDFFNLEAMKYYAPPASWSEEKKKENVRNKIFSGEWWAAEKKDGFFAKIIKDEDGTIILTPRNRNTAGQFVDKSEWLPQLKEFFASLPNGTCILGELHFPARPGSKEVQTIMGCLKDKAIARQEKGDKIHLYVHDCLAYKGEILLNTGYKRRTEYVKGMAAEYPYVTWAKYYSGAELWEHLQWILANGGEGIVLVHEDAPYEPGKRPSKTTLKVKQELRESIDCVIIGANPPTRLYNGKYLETWPYWENERTGEKINSPLAPNGYSECYIKAHYDGEPLAPISKMYYLGGAGSLKCGLVKDGQIEYFCDVSGIEEEILINWKDYVHKVCEISGMMLSKDIAGNISVRHPRFMGFRDDKTAADCRWEQVG